MMFALNENVCVIYIKYVRLCDCDRTTVVYNVRNDPFRKIAWLR